MSLYRKLRFKGWGIIGCPRCKTLQIVRIGDRKTRRCPRCGYRIKLDFRKIRLWHATKDLKEAQYALKTLKLEQADVKHPKFQIFEVGEKYE